MYKSDPDHTYPIMIFPEGTTSNSFSLMRFSNGAFENLAPITLFSLRYECKIEFIQVKILIWEWIKYQMHNTFF